VHSSGTSTWVVLDIEYILFVEVCSYIYSAHIKSHKTVEGTILQLATDPPTDTVIVSTLPEAWGLVNAGLTDSGQIKDVCIHDLFSLIPSTNCTHLSLTR
jgi:hypothetical protein